jgi:hypothetical protein
VGVLLDGCEMEFTVEEQSELAMLEVVAIHLWALVVREPI